MNTEIRKTVTVAAAMTILCVSAMAFIIPSSEGSASDNDTRLQGIVDERINHVAENFDAAIGKEYGIIYEFICKPVLVDIYAQ